MFAFGQVRAAAQSRQTRCESNTYYQQASPSDIQKALVRGVPLKPLRWRGVTRSKMLCAVIGFVIGSLSGVVLMCLFQMNQSKGYGGVNDASRSTKTESEQDDEEMETLLSDFREKGREEIR